MIIDIYSDTVCPWCLIGKRNLELALGTWSGEATLRWHAFQLAPDMPPGGMERDAWLRLKFGPDAGLHIFDRVAEAARAAGVPMAFERIERSPNTLDSHRLIWLAGQMDCQNDMVEALFEAYFMRGKDIGDRDTLCAIAGAVGLDATQTRRFLDSDEAVQIVRDEDAEARELGVGGVPFYLFGGRHPLMGAQPPEAFVARLQQLQVSG